MKLNIFHPETKLVGLQFGDIALRAVELGGLDKRSIVAASEVAIPTGIIQNDTIVDADVLAKSVVQLFEHPAFGKFTTKNVVVNLPESKCFVRVIHMQHMLESEIDNAIPYEAESYVPIPIDQVYLDWQKLSETDGRMELLLIASAKEYVDKVVSVLELARLSPAALEVESQSLFRLLVTPETSQNCLIANIQSARTDLVMIERGGIQFTSTIPLGSAVFTDAISRTLGIDHKAANQIKEQFGIENTTEYPNLKTIMIPMLNNFVAEVRNILTFHAEHSQTPIDTLILTGGGAQLKHLDAFLSEELSHDSITVKCADPFTSIIVPSKLNVPLPALAYSTAFGLALRVVD